MTEDELFYGGSFADAQLLVKKGTGSQFSFRFFVQQTVWKRGALEKELNDGVSFLSHATYGFFSPSFAGEGLAVGLSSRSP